ncbi:MAG: hypothetical protein LLG04_04415 [Parachlamydia sp.]|nr:hypothetical protein [Parachlamydia sp.]
MKKKSALITTAAFGLVAGSMGALQAANPPTCVMPTQSQISSVFEQLDQAHRDMFNTLDCESQNLAVKWIEQTCKGQNSCKGLNTCKTDKNSCAGQGSCKGTSTGPFKDKNEAVELARKMAQKRGRV